MDRVRFERVLALPPRDNRVPGTIYLVGDGNDFLRMVVCGNTKDAIRRIPTRSDLQSMVSEAISSIEAGPTGPQGIPGNAFSVVASENLGGHRLISLTGFYAQPENSDLFGGISQSAVVTGDTVELVRYGVIEEGSWNWTPNAPIFSGPNGILTQTPPTTGIVRRVAWAMDETKINVDFFPTITIN